MKTTPLASVSRRSFIRTTAAAGLASLAVKNPLQAEDVPVTFSLADLPYGFDALEPHIDAKTMEIHHGRHHNAYVNNVNRAVAGREEVQGKSLCELIADLSAVPEDIRTALRNNAGGCVNHDLFWITMAPEGETGEMSDDLGAAIEDAFGDLAAMQEKLNQAAATRFGSGWAWLIVNGDGKLQITSTPNQDNPKMKGVVPDDEYGSAILGVDVWEHAYYLHYQNRRGDYVGAWWNLVNWDEVSAQYANAISA